MLSPEVWDFKPPRHKFFTTEIDCKKIDIPIEVQTHYFNHSVSVILPDSTSFLNSLQTSVLEDTDYYQIRDLRVTDLINKEFIEGFIKTGESTLLTIENKIDLDNCIAVTPSGHLIISLTAEDYQRLGLEGKPSFFDRKVNTRYVTTIDLKAEEFVPGKKNYERIRECLEHLYETFNVVAAWDPPDETICPSSFAAWFYNRGYKISLCRQKFSRNVEFNVMVPTIAAGYDEEKFFEWIGVFSISGDLKKGKSDNFVNTFECPSPSVFVEDMRYFQWTGLFTRKQVEKLYTAIREYVSRNDTQPWVGLHVQGFMDSPVNWGLKEHTFYTDGDNSYTIILQPNSKCIVRRSSSCNNKNRIFQ